MTTSCALAVESCADHFDPGDPPCVKFKLVQIIIRENELCTGNMTAAVVARK